jgi:hypothetical protein
MSLIKTDIIPVKYDVFWEDISSIIKNATTKTVLVLTGEYQPDSPEEKQLMKMLEVSKLLPGQYNIVMLKKDQEVAWHKLRDSLDPKIIFLFGILPAQLGLSVALKLNEPNNFNECIWLPTLSLAELATNDPVKRQLWNEGMQPVFIAKKFGFL